MTASKPRTTKELFRSWRQGDAQAGQAMAQRFADWYYAISVSRLGESQGRGPCENACARFGQGIVQVTESRALVPWAHKIIQDELTSSGDRVRDGDEPNDYTGHKHPKSLLLSARAVLPEEIALLEACYSGSVADAELETMADAFGGMPLGVLKARYTVKQWLKAQQGTPFEVAPEVPILDRAPLPLYESARMASAAEQANFEQWMLSDIDLCRDIAEFAHFAIALRGGLDKVSAPVERPRKVEGAPITESKSAGKFAAAGGVAIVGIALAILVVLVVVAAVIGVFVL